jgi:hypothetical protein
MASSRLLSEDLTRKQKIAKQSIIDNWHPSVQAHHVSEEKIAKTRRNLVQCWSICPQLASTIGCLGEVILAPWRVKQLGSSLKLTEVPEAEGHAFIETKSRKHRLLFKNGGKHHEHHFLRRQRVPH